MTATCSNTAISSDTGRALRAIRRIVTRSFIRDHVQTGKADPATAEILPLLLNLRSDRYPEAAKAHRVIIKQVRSDLRDDGFTWPEYPKLLAELYAYLEAGGFRFEYESGRWENHNCPPGETVIL
jgi:hypothetical protein